MGDVVRGEETYYQRRNFFHPLLLLSLGTEEGGCGGEGPRGGDGERPNQKSKVEREKRGKGKLKTFHFGRKGTHTAGSS